MPVLRQTLKCYNAGMKVVFFDRDGTLVVDPPDLRVDSLDKAILFKDTLPALKLLANNGYSIVIITNQVGIAEGLLDEAKFWEIQNKVIDLLKPSGIKVLKTYLCPHDESNTCVCRKPKPYMLQQAATEFNIYPASTYMVGDRLSDIAAGNSAGTKTILVKSANENVDAPNADYTAPNLMDAAQYIINHPL